MRNKLLNCFCNASNLLWDFTLPVTGYHDSAALRKTKPFLLSKTWYKHPGDEQVTGHLIPEKMLEIQQHFGNPGIVLRLAAVISHRLLVFKLKRSKPNTPL